MSEQILQPGAIAGIDCDLLQTSPTVNSGSAATLRIGTIAVAIGPVVLSFARALIMFDVRPWGDKIIRSVALGINLAPAGNGLTSVQTFHANRCTRRDIVESQACWNNAKTGSPWTAAGGDDDAAVGDTTTADGAATQLLWPNMLTAFLDALAKRDGFFGLLVRGPEVAGQNVFVGVSSDDASNTGPFLIIDSEPAPRVDCALVVQPELDLPCVVQPELIVPCVIPLIV